ncbi:MAG: phosphoribosylanthranilate isomerase [Rhodospirillales bacterium]|nr:phosphoribosylanthranilate isomerase [Rhodospirillales bacterium]
MRIEVKICGLNDPEGVHAAAEAGADFLGFVFFPPSPRAVSPERAAALSSLVPRGPGRVGLFVAPAAEAIAAVLAVLKLDALQIYPPPGAPPDWAGALGARFGLPVWRAVGVAAAADLPASAPGAARLLIEAKPPPGATRPGGNAARFDWSILRGWDAPAPWVLAGGLDPGNVAAAIAASGARAVDVSSGVETAPGQKDPALIRAFVAAARGSI